MSLSGEAKLLKEFALDNGKKDTFKRRKCQAFRTFPAPCGPSTGRFAASHSLENPVATSVILADRGVNELCEAVRTFPLDCGASNGKLVASCSPANPTAPSEMDTDGEKGECYIASERAECLGSAPVLNDDDNIYFEELLKHEIESVEAILEQVGIFGNAFGAKQPRGAVLVGDGIKIRRNWGRDGSGGCAREMVEADPEVVEVVDGQGVSMQEGLPQWADGVVLGEKVDG